MHSCHLPRVQPVTVGGVLWLVWLSFREPNTVIGVSRTLVED